MKYGEIKSCKSVEPAYLTFAPGEASRPKDSYSNMINVNRSVPILGIRSVRSSLNPQLLDPIMASLEEKYEMDADAMADRDKITGLLYTINGD